MDGWIVTRDRERSQTPRGSQCKPVFPVSRCRANKRCPLNRPFSGKNSLTRLTRNAVICKAFPAKRFISCPWGKRQPLFFSTLTQSLTLALSSFSWSELSISNMHVHRGGHNNRNKPCNKHYFINVERGLISIICGVIALDFTVL